MFLKSMKVIRYALEHGYGNEEMHNAQKGSEKKISPIYTEHG